MGKESEDKLPETTEEEAEPNVSKALPALPTKETSPKHTLAQEEEPMDVYSSDPYSMKDKKMTEAQSAVEDPEQKQEREKQEALDPEVISIVPEPASVQLIAETSPTIEMDTTPVSEHSFSSFSSPVEDKCLVLKHSPGLSSEGSIKLTQSPFSTEASPRESSQNQTPTHGLNQAGYSPNVSNTAFFPLTPKIGMGKPAISKRKFSPGRPRVKQVNLLHFMLGEGYLFSLGPFRTLILSVIPNFQPQSNYSFALHVPSSHWLVPERSVY